jgi:glycosyltransferase involved in cell wall biosynthesis
MAGVDILALGGSESPVGWSAPARVAGTGLKSWPVIIGPAVTARDVSCCGEMMAESKLAVLHVAYSPQSGIWSLMRELVRAQRERPDLVGRVGLGLVINKDYPELCRQQQRELEVACFYHVTPRFPGSHLVRLKGKPPIGAWLRMLSEGANIERFVVHFHSGSISSMYLPVRAPDSRRVAAVATYHGGLGSINYHGKPIRKFMHTFMARRLERLTTVLTAVDQHTPHLADDYYGLKASGFRVITNGVRSSTLRGCPCLKEPYRPFTVGYAGVINNMKGAPLILEAVRELAAEGIAIKLLLAGHVYAEIPMEAWLREHAGILEFRGIVGNTREEILKDCDVFAMMSDAEGLPMAIVEAMSIGVPVVSTGVGGIPDAVLDGQTGFIVERTKDALKARLRHLHEDRALLAQMHALSLERFARHFDIERIAERYSSLYNEITQRP